MSQTDATAERTPMNLMPPPAAVLRSLLDACLAEDLGEGGDLTSTSVIGADQRSTATVVARAGGAIAGLEAALGVFALLDGDVSITQHVQDGEVVDAMTPLATLEGSTRAILIGERTMLNLLGHLSGIATATRQVVDLVSGTGAKVVDTRKTTPGLRAVEKYAVRCGGGSNHRFGLHDAVMLKDNHLAAAGSITTAVHLAKAAVGHTVVVEVEVDRLDQLEEAVTAGADIVLLDNMGPDILQKAVAQIDGRAIAEASGGITPDSVRAIAESGVDVISLGWITHSAPRLDVALDF